VVPLSWTIIGSDNNGLIFWRDTAGDLAIWQMSASKVVNSAGLGNVPSNWSIAGLGDFYGDGNTGILWRGCDTGGVVIWRLQGIQFQSGVSIGVVPSVWNIVQTGDYNGDGKSDILWEDSSGGSVHERRAGRLDRRSPQRRHELDRAIGQFRVTGSLKGSDAAELFAIRIVCFRRVRHAARQALMASAG
jgi:hypothetical protein